MYKDKNHKNYGNLTIPLRVFICSEICFLQKICNLLPTGGADLNGEGELRETLNKHESGEANPESAAQMADTLGVHCNVSVPWILTVIIIITFLSANWQL